jgi:SAM-dependent methyltransferase
MNRSRIAVSLLCLLLAAGVSAQTAPSRAPDVIYVPTPQPVVEEMLRMAEVSKDDLVYDLGCGDGRLVVTAAKKFGARGVGIDIDPVRIKESRANAAAAGVTDRVKFLNQDLFESDFRDATAVTLYLLSTLNVKLRPILLDQLKPGTPIVSHDFDMGDWEPEMAKDVKGPTRVHRVYRWTVPAKTRGAWRIKAGDRVFELALKQNYNSVTGLARSRGREHRILNGSVWGTRLSLELSHGGGTLNGLVEGRTFTGQYNHSGQILHANGELLESNTVAKLN